MNKTVLAACFLFLMLSGILRFFSFARANPELLYFKPGYCSISIQSPETGSCNAESFPINFTAKTNYELDVNSGHYILDGQDNGTGVKVEDFKLTGEEVIDDEVMPDINTTYNPYTEYVFSGRILLGNLSEGEHKLWVDIENSEGKIVAIETLTFTIPYKSEPFPTTLLIVSAVAVVAVVGLGLLVYLKKRRRPQKDMG
jgi:hypothetical protein